MDPPSEVMFSESHTNYLIFDTCVLIHCGELFARILLSIWLKRLNFKIIIPIVVRKELEWQAFGNDPKYKENISSFISWFDHPEYLCNCIKFSDQAKNILKFFDKCVIKNIPNFSYQGNDHTVVFHAEVNDDFLLDCQMFYHRNHRGPTFLISNDTELCTKAEHFKMNVIHDGQHEKWRCLLRASQVDDIPEKLLSCPVPTGVRNFKPKLTMKQKEEIGNRAYRYRWFLSHLGVIHVDDLDYIEPIRKGKKWLDRPILESKLVFQD